MSTHEYLHEMDVQATRNAITVAQMPEEVRNWIWEEQKSQGLVWLS